MIDAIEMKTEPLATVWVSGKPASQGNLVAYTRGTYDSNMKEVKPWQDHVRENFKLNMAKPAEGPLEIAIVFSLERPGTHYRKDGKHSCLYREYPEVRPDLRRFAIVILDALKGIAYVNEGQVVSLKFKKHYGNHEGAFISVSKVLETTENN